MRFAITAALLCSLTLIACSVPAKIANAVNDQIASNIAKQLGATPSEVVPIKKLSFMRGTWRCVVRGGSSDGYKDRLSYSFSPGYHWMVEQESGVPGYPASWTVQMWGYDDAHQKLAAYQFTPAGVFTKSVKGWQNGTFVSRRDDNGATVTIRPKNSRAFDWVIASPDRSSTVVQACTR